MNVLGMEAVHITMNAFLPWILEESVVFLRNSATVLTYLKMQGGHCFRGDVQSGTGDHGLGRTALSDLSMSCIPVKINILVDQLSCPNQVLPRGWSLLPGSSVPSVRCSVVLTWTCLLLEQMQSFVCMCLCFQIPGHGSKMLFSIHGMISGPTHFPPLLF